MGQATFTRLGEAEGLPRNGIKQAARRGGEIYLTPLYEGTSYRWDRPSRRFVPGNRFLRPLGEGLNRGRAVETPEGDIWSVSHSLTEQRQGLFRKQADGQYRLEEAPYRLLSRSNHFGAYRAPDGSVWLDGDQLLHFDPTRASALDLPPLKTLVRQITNGAGEVLYGGLGEPVLTLPPGTDSLLFDFATNAFGAENETSYRYRLGGADSNWSAWVRQAQARYSGLGPGVDRFHVRGKAMDGRESAEATFDVTITPPWYRSPFAYGFYALMFFRGLFGTRRRTVAHERARAAWQTDALEPTVAERTKEIATQRDSINLLNEIGKEITASLDLKTILFKLYERANQITDASIFGVGLHRPEQNAIEYTLAIENGKRYAPYVRSTLGKNQLPVWCIDHRRPVMINDVADEAQRYIEKYEHKERLLEDGTRAQAPQSLIYLPLIAQDRVLGVLSVQSFQKNAYDEQDLSLLENLAAYTTIALDNAGACGVINQRAAEMATMNRISQALSSQLDTTALVQLVGEQVRDVFRAPIAYVSLLDRATMMLHFPYSFGQDSPSRPFSGGITSRIIRTGEPLLINQDMDGTRERLGIEQMGKSAASYLGVPIVSGGETVGVISVQSTEAENRFTENDQRLLSTIASAVGVALHNARLFEETRQAKKVAEEADAAKSSFLSTVSHELRTPLTSVLGFAKIIRRRLEERLFPLIPEDDKKIAQAKTRVVENLGVVVSEGERLTKLIDDVLDLAKIEAGKFTWNMARLEIGDVIERALAATASLFDAKKLTVVREVAEGLPPLTGDRDRLIQVVINLISNAVKFTDAGSVKCAARLRPDGLIEVAVVNSGIGIAPADQPKVFEKFKQVGDTLTDKPKGTGLGLPICKEIVEYHGGRIWVESTPGTGSTFAFTLPCEISELSRQEESVNFSRSALRISAGYSTFQLALS
ncbi:MAG: GAF domain-containing protein, partial [Acidobacteria bacterium]|nr:GAF domain-containing protein [Acidobacteriota bacterium]